MIDIASITIHPTTWMNREAEIRNIEILQAGFATCMIKVNTSLYMPAGKIMCYNYKEELVLIINLEVLDGNTKA